MAIRPQLAHRGLYIVIAGLLCFAMLTPVATLADTNLEVGGKAQIAYANGDNVRLRDATSSDAAVLVELPEGAQVDVLDGPLTADDGNLWYNVAFEEHIGFIVADFLALPSTEPVIEEPVTEEATEEGTETVAEPAVEEPPAVVPPGEVIGTALIVGTNGEGIRCRVDAFAEATVITVVPEGTLVDLTGDLIDVWQPVNCGGQAGFVHSDFLSYDGSVPATEEPVAEEPVAESPTEEVTEEPTEEAIEEPTEEVTEPPTAEPTDEPTEEATEVPTEEPTEEATEEPATDEPAEEDPTTDPTEEATETPTEEPTAEATDVATPDATDAPTPAPSDEPAAEPTVEPPALVGTGVVTGTNGGGARCRTAGNDDADVITVVAEGTAVGLRRVAKNGWQPVRCADRNGYIDADFVTVDNGEGGTGGKNADVTSASIGSGVISGANGDGVRCRTAGSDDASVITILTEGTAVSLRRVAKDGWQPVRCADRNGYVDSSFITVEGSEGGFTAASSGSSTATGTATVTGTDGGGLRCRAGAGTDASIIVVLPEGSKVDLRGEADDSGQWQRVFCAGRKGWVASEYLSNTSGGGGGTQGSSTSGLKSGDKAKVTGTNGDGVRLRSSASTSSSIITVVAEGQVVTVRSGSTGSWIAVTYNGSKGFIHKDYLTKTTSGGSSSGGGGGGSSGAYRLSDGDHARTKSALNLRTSPSWSAGVEAVAPNGTVVLITGTPKSGFYPVDWDGLSGYMHTDYLSKTTAALSQRGTSGGSNGGGGGGGSATGNEIVDYAMQYLGYPYVWATHGPGSFDCSGFTYWVVLNVLGRDIGAGLWTQVSAGAAVSRSSLQPGDLVFFQNTYTWGLSHVGIYIGGGQFIHAENESTGVRISDLGSPYYSSRWYGAVRLT